MTAQEPEQDNVNHSSSSLTQDADKKMMKDLSKAEACLTQDAKKKKIKEKLKAEARKEFKTLLIGSIAMVVSTVSNQGTCHLKKNLQVILLYKYHCTVLQVGDVFNISNMNLHCY